MREVGRQPWVIYGLLRTHDGTSILAAPTVAFTTIGYSAIYTMLFVTFLIFAWRIIQAGPDLNLLAPERDIRKQDVEGHRASVHET